MDNMLDFAVSTRSFHGGDRGFDAFVRLSEELYGQPPYCLVCDGNTWKAAGEDLDRYLIKAGRKALPSIIFPAEPVLEADYGHVPGLVKKIAPLAGNVQIIAVGSGTLNDLVKTACGELKRPYSVFATAASVDGYASDGAAIVKDGYKQTIRCPAPELIVADRTVLNNAPADMTAAGYADLIAKIPAGADWIMADILGEDPIHGQVWDYIQKPLRDWVKLPLNMDKLYTGLTATGFAMQYIQKSRPASGAEHLISHIWEMEHLTYRGKTFSHGFKVGIGSLLTTCAMEKVLSYPMEAKDAEKAIAAYPDLEKHKAMAEDYFTEPLLSSVLDILEEKIPSPEAHAKRVKLIAGKWEELRTRILEQIIPYRELKRLLAEVGSPSTLEDLGVDKKIALETMKKAQMIRNRYTILDLIDDLGWWDRDLLEYF